MSDNSDISYQNYLNEEIDDEAMLDELQQLAEFCETKSNSQEISRPWKIPSSKLELTLSAKDLKNVEVFGVIDPFVVTYEMKGGNWEEISRSEICWNTTDPNWCQTVKLDYFFEMNQPIRFEIYDAKDEHESCRNILHRLDFLGGFETVISDLVKNSFVQETLIDRNGKGRIEKNIENFKQSKFYEIF